MKMKYPAIVLILVAFLLVSCESSRTKEKIETFKKGMTQQEVIAELGEPIKGEVYCKPNVLFYYTDPQWSDGNMTSDECTPMVFENNKLIGWGTEFYKDYRQKDWK